MTSVEFTGPCLPRGSGFPALKFRIADHVDTVRKPNHKVQEVMLRYYLLTGIRAVEMLAYYPNLQTLNLSMFPSERMQSTFQSTLSCELWCSSTPQSPRGWSEPCPT
ncbi:hypothetical protein MVEG_02390 [Podila verticillata NRRL 6337]|nr:hypothetical protein MVEG_02390 [Podila verticillata NRRL 6337]